MPGSKGPGVCSFTKWESTDSVVSRELDVKLGLTFEEMTSPREYNFETDRVFADVSAKTLGQLWKLSADDRHETLAATIRKRFTSRDGFISFYSNCKEDWLKKPLTTWDHNETGTLLLACLEIKRVDDVEMSVYYSMSESNDFYTAFDRALNWEKFDADVAELRADKEAELRADDPDYIAPTPRCPLTLDLFRDYVSK